ncbi:hypothetical protein T440DRAFT_162092 [Plenodomus tracheiphilus IPT5]|uniref:Uncharacterized protein n=1 Tax=Plenodomus tracheiphilus IPT5 TaxID=1408161 RepID=A0A6A7BK33_9PLEO|nr:hypothetical protein T440DRAFT_162092 [Plenodomus tracheiphilus IPT5]
MMLSDTSTTRHFPVTICGRELQQSARAWPANAAVFRSKTAPAEIMVKRELRRMVKWSMRTQCREHQNTYESTLGICVWAVWAIHASAGQKQGFRSSNTTNLEGCPALDFIYALLLAPTRYQSRPRDSLCNGVRGGSGYREGQVASPPAGLAMVSTMANSSTSMFNDRL